MSIASAKTFRQQILRPAEGIFLFHARAIERLIEEQFGAGLQGVSIPDLPYYLMPRNDFLLGLETENTEALSVIEGLRLPDYVILLPSPIDQGLEERGLRRLQQDYWARGFEAEVARAWQMARDDNRDSDLYGARHLESRIGPHAFAEVRDVLDRDGVTLPIWDDFLVCRSFVAAVVRLRYFAPGARGFFFPAIEVWPEIDQWLSDSGLDLPEPLQTSRMPMLLVRSRPGGGDFPAELPLLPTALPFGRSDPDLPRAIAAAQQSLSPTIAPVVPILSASDDSDVRDESGSNDLVIGVERRLLDALRRGSAVRRRRGRVRRLRDGLDDLGWRLIGRLVALPGIDDVGFYRAGSKRGPEIEVDTDDGVWRARWHALGLGLFERATACAQRAEFEGRFALALRYLAQARGFAQRIDRPAHSVSAVIEQALSEREAAAEMHLADLLAAKWKLDPASATEIRSLVGRLAAEDRRRYGSAPARALLFALEQLLAEGRKDYYVLRPFEWLFTRGRARIRQVLPFQSLLKALRALETGRLRLEDMLWSISDLERFGQLLSTLNDRVTARLDAQIAPRVDRAMRDADFVPRNHRETVAAQKMKLELLDVIKRRRHLKFTDARDIVARNILRLPDPTIDEFFRGDRLRRFDRTATRALPGIYRPGELYIKGLQQLGAPLFGTQVGRTILRHLLLPFGSAYLVLKSLDLLIELIPNYGPVFQLTSPLSVALIGGAVNLFAFSGVGRHVAGLLWYASAFATRFLLYDGARRFLRWGPVAQLLNTGLLRGLGRNLVQPLLIGTLPLIPIIMLAVFVDEVPIQPGLWLAGLAFALGTLARNTPGGRRFLDNLSTSFGTYLRRINQKLFIGAIQQLMYFFKEATRRFYQLLHRVDEALTHHLGEHPGSLAVKALLAPIWRLAESLIQFYVTVLVEPQVNPVKHFPIVTIGHKLLLPFLPAITATFIEVSVSVLPKVIAYPLVTLTIVLLPGLFGFLVWELKENRKLYQANHRDGMLGADGDEVESGHGAAVEPAVLGAHGETMIGLMSRGFHSGTLPKGFDRLRKIVTDEVRDEIPYPKRLRRVQRQLEEVQQAVSVFFEREFAFALRERCRDPECTLRRVETEAPRIATNLIELRAELFSDGAERSPRRSPSGQLQTSIHPVPARSALPLGRASIQLCIRISQQNGFIRFKVGIDGQAEQITPYCWTLICDDLRLFAGRSGAREQAADLALPAPCADNKGPVITANLG
ncbi:MAG: sulfite exporter TauE/SafE family protein [Thiohalocapsa sp.]